MHAWYFRFFQRCRVTRTSKTFINTLFGYIFEIVRLISPILSFNQGKYSSIGCYPAPLYKYIALDFRFIGFIWFLYDQILLLSESLDSIRFMIKIMRFHLFYTQNHDIPFVLWSTSWYFIHLLSFIKEY